MTVSTHTSQETPAQQLWSVKISEYISPEKMER